MWHDSELWSRGRVEKLQIGPAHPHIIPLLPPHLPSHQVMVVQYVPEVQAATPSPSPSPSPADNSNEVEVGVMGGDNWC